VLRWRYFSDSGWLTVERPAVTPAERLSPSTEQWASLRRLHLVEQALQSIRDAGEAGFGTADGALFRDAAAALERCAALATAADVWQVSPADAAALERLLALHDEQLASTPVGVMHGAQKRIARFARSDRKVPWQETGP